MRAVGNFLDRFVPSNIRARSHQQSIRARVLVAALLLGCVVTALAELPSLLQVDKSFRQQLPGLVVTGLTIAFYVGCLIIFRRTASLILAGNIYGLGAYCGITAAVAVTGGFQRSPFLQLLLLVPLFLFLICGRRSGYVWTLVIITTFSLFFALSKAGIEIPNLASTAHQDTIVLVLWVVLCFSLMSCLAIYDGISEQLTHRIQSERDKFEHEAAHDLLTGLANRRTYHRILDQSIAACRESGTQLALLFIDLNGFKPINDRFGHHAGDFVLQVVAERLKKVVRASDTVARMGGDEFAVILHSLTDSSMPLRIAQNIQNKILEPMEFENRPLLVNASVGIACYPEDGGDSSTLTRFADSAMYTAKHDSIEHRAG